MAISDARPSWRFIKSDTWPLILLLLLGLLVGLSWGNDFGLSLDEAANAEAGAEALRAYVGSGDYYSLPSLDEHGPIYFMLFVSTSRAFHALEPSWTPADGRHLTNFLVFLAGVLCFHLLCIRIVRRPFAWMATILFATQPLLVGHAFINQKDMPFLTLFMATILLGLAWLDRGSWTPIGRSSEQSVSRPRPVRTGVQMIVADWRRLPPRRKVALATAFALVGLLALDLAVLGVIDRTGRALVIAAFNGRAPAPIQRLFALVATDAFKTPVALYLAKYDSAMLVLRQLLAPILFLALPIGCSAALPSLAETWGCSRRALLDPYLIVGGLILGCLICVRQVGAFAGVLVSLAIFYRGRSKSLFSLVVYWSLAAIVTLVTWPYLWPDPIGHFLQSVFGVASFSSHTVLFQGQKYSSTDLPWQYFPTLTGLELTEPAVILVFIGLCAAAWNYFAKRKRSLTTEHALLGLWFAVPLIVVLLLSPSIYGNIRQLLFMLPPLFILAGVGLQAIGSAIRFKASGVLLAAVVVLPGVVGIVRLHPYEYAYFNAFTGGVAGADGKYALDPWCISFREATEVASSLAKPNARLVSVPSSSQIEPFLRKDIQLLPRRSSVDSADIVVTCTYRDSEDWPSVGFHPVYRVDRDGAVLAEVWERSDIALP